MEHAPRNEILAPYGILDTPPEPGYDDAVLLARELCDAPVALVSVVAENRQWFKARANFPDCETDLERSICRFVVAEADLIVIPDLTLDPRTAANPLVTEAPRVRFYAGAPLAVEGGVVLGALCVLDTVPRPEGLSARQRGQLVALARSVSQQLELRRALVERDRAMERSAAEEARRRVSDRRWGDLFQAMNEGFIIGSLIRDDLGRIVDWRYDEVNRAWGRLVDADHTAAVGRTIREVFPMIEDAWVMEPGRAVELGAPVRFTRTVGALDRWYDGVIQPIGGERFMVLFTEVTDRIYTERRLEALAEISERLRDWRSVGEMTRGTAAIVGRLLHASRAGYGHVDEATREVLIEPDWTAEGVASIAGVHRFEDFGRIRDELARAEPLVIEDVGTDPRTADDPGPMRALDIGALVNMPVRERGRTVGVFIVQSPVARVWTAAELGFIRGVADRLESGIARARSETQQELLNAEIAHRLKNSLAIVQAIANQMLRGADRAQLNAFHQRIRALGTAHDALLGRDIQSAELGDVVRRVLEAAGVERYAAAGPMVSLGARATLSTSLLLHELATNAIKYGALSSDGHVVIAWRDAGAGALLLEWTERGGPPAEVPARKGFGSRLLSLGLVGTGGAVLRFEEKGFSASFTASREHLQAA